MPRPALRREVGPGERSEIPPLVVAVLKDLRRVAAGVERQRGEQPVAVVLVNVDAAQRPRVLGDEAEAMFGAVAVRVAVEVGVAGDGVFGAGERRGVGLRAVARLGQAGEEGRLELLPRFGDFLLDPEDVAQPRGAVLEFVARSREKKLWEALPAPQRDLCRAASPVTYAS